MFHSRTYLDYASAMPLSKKAARAYARAAQVFGNPSSPHQEGREAKNILEDARTKIARLTEVKADDVIFTSGATEANNLAIRGLAKPGSHFLYLPSAHASVVETMQALEKEGSIVEPLVIQNGRVDIAALKKQIRAETMLVSMDAVCGETGTIWNTREVKNALKETAYLHVDATQAPLGEKITRAHFGADLLTFDAQKVGGMRGIGCLITHRTTPLRSVMTGGGQERGLRPGTESPALAHSFAEALQEAADTRETFFRKASSARTTLIETLSKGISNLHINEGAKGVPHILNVSLPGRDTDYLVALLNEAGFAISTRSACETDSKDGSRAVFTLTGDLERAKTTLRISWGRETRESDLGRFAKVLIREVVFVDKKSP